MSFRVLVCALLCTVGTIVPVKSDDDRPRGSPSRYFKDVKVMSYIGFVQTKGRCAIDWKAWNTAMDFVANQSVKLKLIPEYDYWKQTKQLSDEASKAAQKAFDYTIPEKNRQELQKAWEEARERLGKSWAPTLYFSIDTLELVSGCVGEVEAKVEVVLQCGDNPLSTCTIKGTDKTVPNPSVTIWSNDSLISAPFATFSSFAIETSEQIMKRLVNDWAKSQELF
jgi:hypothetical protein